MKPIVIDEAYRAQIIDEHDCFIFDCDGVLWLGSSPVPGARETLGYLKSLNKEIFFFTNNSTKSRALYVTKINQLLDFQVSVDQIISTSWLVAEYLKSVDYKSGLIYLVGSEGIADELRQANFSFIGVGRDPYLHDFKVELNPAVNCVVAGFDPHISYPKIAKAASYVRRRDCMFIITNEDPDLPSLDRNIVVPGTGSVVAGIKVASSVTPVVLGKPHDLAWKLLTKAHAKLDSRTTLMIGDRLETDIAFGRNCGLSTMAVLTGHTSSLEIEAICKTMAGSSSNLVPHYLACSVKDLLRSTNCVEK